MASSAKHLVPTEWFIIMRFKKILSTLDIRPGMIVSLADNTMPLTQHDRQLHLMIF